MGDHGHTPREVMLSYRFMAMDMQGLRSGTTPVETADVLKDFMMVPTADEPEPSSGRARRSKAGPRDFKQSDGPDGDFCGSTACG